MKIDEKNLRKVLGYLLLANQGFDVRGFERLVNETDFSHDEKLWLIERGRKHYAELDKINKWIPLLAATAVCALLWIWALWL